MYEQYFRRLESIQVQFDFARKAIKGFIQNTDPSIPLPKEPNPISTLADLHMDDDQKWIAQVLESVEAVKGGFPEKHKDLENTLAQNEVILIVAVFEDQMRAIHREVLIQNPSLLNPDREIKLGKLVALKQERVIADEIERAVQALDRMSAKDKAKAFEKLGLPWRHRVEAVERVTLLRNRILHEDTEIVVSGWELGSARSTAIALPLQLYFVAELLYPNGFNSGVTAEERGKWAKQVTESLQGRS